MPPPPLPVLPERHAVVYSWLSVGSRKLDELHADVEARGSAGRKRLHPYHLDTAGDLALVGEKQLQFQAITDRVRFVGEEAHASEADVDRLATAEERLAGRTAQDRGLQSGELATVVGHEMELSSERPRRRSCARLMEQAWAGRMRRALVGRPRQLFCPHARLV